VVISLRNKLNSYLISGLSDQLEGLCFMEISTCLILSFCST